MRIGPALVRFSFVCPCPVSLRQKAKFFGTAEATLATAWFLLRHFRDEVNKDRLAVAPALQVLLRKHEQIHESAHELISKLSSEVNVVSILSGYVMHEMACARMTLE